MFEAFAFLEHTTSVSELRSFLGLCNVYKWFVPNFAPLAAPLKMKLKKGEPLQFWMDATEREAVDTLKEKLISPTALALPL